MVPFAVNAAASTPRYNAGETARGAFSANPALQTAAADSVQFGKNRFPVKDPVQHGQLGPLSDTQRWQDAKAEIFNIFDAHPDRDGLIKAATDAMQTPEARQRGIQGLKIYDGAQPGNEWVSRALIEGESSVGYLVNPKSLRHDYSQRATYGGKVPDDPASVTAEINFHPDKIAAHPEYHHAQMDLFRTRQLGLFLHGDPESFHATKLGTLKHELIHAFQFKHGLSGGSRNRAIDKAANDFIADYNAPVSRFGLVNATYMMAKRLLSWTVGVPLIFAKGLVTGRLFTRPAADADTPGKAVRQKMALERKVDEMFVWHGSKIHATPYERLMHALHYFEESALQHLRSYKLDYQGGRSTL